MLKNVFILILFSFLGEAYAQMPMQAPKVHEETFPFKRDASAQPYLSQSELDRIRIQNLNQSELVQIQREKQAREIQERRQSELGIRDRIESRRRQLHLQNSKNTEMENALQDEIEGAREKRVKERFQVGFDRQSINDEIRDAQNEITETNSFGESLSNVEDIFNGRFPDSISRNLRQFGYDLFNRKPSSFTPLEDVPVNYDYVVGPGDTFTVNVWGSANFSHTVTVNREGNIFIPKVGTLKVWGKTWQDMSRIIRTRLGNFFSGIKVDIALEGIRMLDVYIIGEVEQPGAYSVPSTATPINALFYSGGPKKKGTMRNIKVLRNNKEIAKIDLYDFLISGIHTKQKLQSQDVIMVPVIGGVAAVGGHVKRPAIYEIDESTTVYDLLQLAGGLSFAGSVGRLSLERVDQNKNRVVRDIQIPENFSEMSKEMALKTELQERLQDGDMLQIFPVSGKFEKTVFLRGHVKRPGSYEFKSGMRLTDLIPNFEVLLSDPYTAFIQVVREVPPKDEKKALFTSLDDAINGSPEANISLQAGDEVYVFSKEELNLREKVSVEGKVNQPGEYYFFEGMRLRDLILMAGNLTNDAYAGKAEIARYIIEKDKLNFKRISVNLDAALSGEASNNPELLPKDKIFVRGLPGWQLGNQINIIGQVKYPGRYSFFKNERLSNVIERAGGFTDQAFLPGTVFNRVSVRKMQEQSLKEQITRLEEALLQESVNPTEAVSTEDLSASKDALAARKALLRNLQNAEVTGRMVIGLKPLDEFRGSKNDIRLEPGDSITIPQIPSVVNIMGEVYSPTSIVFESGRNVAYYLERAGGPTISADTESIFVIKADGSVISKRQDRGFLLRNFYQTRVERGDTILVPKDISRFSWLQTTKDLTDIIFKIASTTGITIQAFK